MWRYAVYCRLDVTTHEKTVISYYDDFSIISEHAIPALKWAVGASIMKGNTERTLNPMGYATRAEVVTMILNYLNSIKQ